MMPWRTRLWPEVVEATDVKDEVESNDSSGNWDELPELILVQVFGHLGREDRASVARVCQHWANCLSSPSLWRRCTVTFDQDFGGSCSLANELLLKYGEHMRSLELAWSQPYRSHPTSIREKPQRRLQQLIPKPPSLWRQARSIPAEAGADFLGTARAKDVQLRELSLKDWANSGKWANCGKLLYAVANLLAGQQNLEKLSLHNASLTKSEVLRLLAIVGKFSGSRLAWLDLRGAFKDWQAPYTSSRYFKLLNRLEALVHLSLDYPALSNGALNALASGASETLRTLQIVVRESDSRHHRIDDSTWRNVREACPLLLVTYIILNLSHHEDVCYLLLPNVPLTKFHMYDSHMWDQNRTRNFRGTVGLLLNHYTATLSDVLLQIRYNREIMDDLIMSMVTRCRRLQHLKFEGIMHDIGTVHDICQLQTDCKTRFQSIHLNINAKNVNMYNRRQLHEIGRQFNEKLTTRGVDFRVENPA